MLFVTSRLTSVVRRCLQALQILVGLELLPVHQQHLRPWT